MALGIHLTLFDRGYDAVGAAVPVRRVIYHTMPFLFSSAVVRSNFSLWCPPRPNLSSSTSFWRDGCDVSCFCRRNLNPMELSHSACRPDFLHSHTRNDCARFHYDMHARSRAPVSETSDSCDRSSTAPRLDLLLCSCRLFS